MAYGGGVPALLKLDRVDDLRYGKEGKGVHEDQQLTTNTMDDLARSDGGRRRGN